MSDYDRRSEDEESEEVESEEEEEEEPPKPAAPAKKIESDADRKKREAEEARKRMEEEERRKREEKERKKADVRKRLEEAAKSKKAKKGFMTPDRKKKLRLLLRKKAADELKKEQERKAQERRRIINERVGNPKPLDSANEAELVRILKEYHSRILAIEDIKYDLEIKVIQMDYEVNELNICLNDLRGKFVKPALRKVPKDHKFAKLAKATTKTLEHNFRGNLKAVQSSKFTIEEEDKQVVKPEWALGANRDAKGGEDDE